ncbi:MAG: tRNA preQ1(34) S-adenosylmethionine ribosyltransferase-isomerase QueA [Acidobacteria bacterium]|nr:tRNA preQ1(34) S-adenosylmethionine ribosyltransferase-isomerase QueA [Acidobacteriota bacterium]
MKNLSEYDFVLPEDQIAERPTEVRSASRMMAVDRHALSFDDSRFERLPDFLRPGDLLVVNNTRVFPARLIGRTETGAAVEILLERDLGNQEWRALARPARKLKPGKWIIFDPELYAELIERGEGGMVRVRFNADGDLFEHFDRVGRTPLPPYIKRDLASPDEDRERYQTVYAEKRGAIAAPTAGLHFTDEVLDRLRAAGVLTCEITLHVGYGTFEPVRSEDLLGHAVLPERYEVNERSAEMLSAAKREGRRIIAVGTTTTRTLENMIAEFGEFRPANGEARLTILPGHEFKAIDGLLTNFHLPKSSLLVLVSAFGGHELIMKAYRHAVSAGYRFYSYGDCMLIL